MLLSTTQMSRVHRLDSYTLNVNCKGDPLERIQCTKLLELHLDQHLIWNEHITKTLASCYGTLAVLRKPKHMAPCYARKQLESASLYQAGLRLCSVRSITSLSAATPPESAKCMCGVFVKEIRLMSLTFFENF